MTKLVEEKITAAPIDAASVILIRDKNESLQTLLLCRSNSRTVMNSAWVFPGGKVDASDFTQTQSIQSQLESSARDCLNEPDLDNDTACALYRAACRETEEETGVCLSPAELQTWSRWITPDEPSMMKKRFDARFFVALIPHGQTAIHDGSEATDSQWCAPETALRDYIKEKLVLAPPQIMTLIALRELTSTTECLQHARQTPAYTIKPLPIISQQTRILTYPGDPDHPEQRKQMPGPTRLTWNGKYFEPPGGFEQYLI